MSARPYMKLWIADYLGDTQHLTCEQSGAYLHLLMAMWRAGGAIENSDKVLARVARVSTYKWKAIGNEIKALLVEDGKKISQKRLTLELIRSENKSRKCSDAARSKYLKNKELVSANGERSHSHSHSHIKEDSIGLFDKQDGEKPKAKPNGKAPNDLAKAFENWNVAAEQLGLRKCRALDKLRAQKLNARLGDVGLKGWNDALHYISEMSFCLGENRDGWKVTFDWLLSPTNLNKVLEKQYARDEPKGATK